MKIELIENLNTNLIELVDIENIEKSQHINMVDICVEDDETFVLSNGIISHNSAMTPLEASSNPKIHGLFPLRGKPENCFAKSLSDVVSQEFMHISRILNLSITNPKYEDMRYKEIIIATDADYDGYHITMLLTLLFKKFWSRLLEEGRVKIIQTPTVIVTYKGKKYNFIKEEDYNKWIVGKTGYTTKYCKGLGGHDSKTFKSFIDDPNSYVTIGYEPERDDESLAMAFDPKRADDRKEWVAIV